MSNAFKCDYDILTANDDGIRKGKAIFLYVHTFEGRDLDAVAMARYQLSPSAGGSYHIVIDVEGKTARENDDEYIPWAAMYTANRNGFHVSLAGRAAFTRQQWLNRPKQLDKLAQIAAAYERAYGIPVIIRFAPDLIAGRPGLSTHAEASKAWKESDHTDPGVGFPLDVIVDKVKALKTPPPPPPATPETIVDDRKYASYVDGRPLRFSEYIRFIDEKVTRLYDEAFPAGPDTAVDISTDRVGQTYPSYADRSKHFTLDQYLRLIDLKVTRLTERQPHDFRHRDCDKRPCHHRNQ